MPSTNNIVNRQHFKNARSSFKKQLRKNYVQNWLKTRSNSSEGSREKFTHKEIKNDYHLEDYLKTIRNPAHRISITKLRLAVHSLRIQTGKYENKGASIPVEERTCLICKINCIEDERHFLMYCQEYDDIRHELHFLIYNNEILYSF